MMRGLFLFCALCLLSGSLVEGAGIHEVSYYCIPHIAVPPVIDGMLDDSCWQEAEPHTATYEYLKQAPGPGALKNTIRMVYDDFGLYLSIVNYEAHPEKIRKERQGRDDINLWRDDCAEIYMDNQPNGPGYRKFTVSAGGVVADVLQIDGNVSKMDWNAAGWLCKTKILSDRWNIECFFPWEDLGRKAEAGQVWRFCHTRYAWPDGNFIGTTSDPGGNYKALDNFGYLCFLKAGEKLNQADMLALFGRLVTPPWGMMLGENLVYDSGKGVRIVKMQDKIDEEVRGMRGWLDKVARDPGAEAKTVEKLRKRLEAMQQNRNKVFRDYHKLLDMKGEVKQCYWRRKLAKEFY